MHFQSNIGTRALPFRPFGGPKRRQMCSALLICLASLTTSCNVIIPEPRDEYVDGRLRVTYWEKWTGFEGDAIRATVDRFNEKQDRIFVDLITMSQIDRKVLVAIAGGEPPDLVGLWSNGLPAFAEKRALTPLSPLMDKAGMRREDFVEVFLDLNSYQGELYGLPTTPATVALHWNKAMFRDAGLDPEQPPRTLAELDEMAQQLTKYDEDGHLMQLGFSPAEPGWWPWSWPFWFGGDLWDGEDITFDTPENLAAYEWVQSYSDRYGAEPLRRFQSGVAGNFASPQNPFFTGKVAMVAQGVWMANFISQYAPDLEWGAAPFPSGVDGMTNVTLAECDSICIPAGARHPEEAFEFMQFLSSQEGAELLNLGQRKFTPLKEVSADFLEQHPNPYIELFIDLASSKNVAHSPCLSVWFEYQDEITAMFDAVMYDQDTPEHALAQVQQRVDGTWQRAKDRMDRRAAAEGGAPE
ncbi:MAG: ABC transporter substrate-binding protein [bacterium]|nr:ABC transporter substrate-binding protein [bacterium]